MVKKPVLLPQPKQKKNCLSNNRVVPYILQNRSRSILLLLLLLWLQRIKHLSKTRKQIMPQVNAVILAKM